jgi:hypothetical protein
VNCFLEAGGTVVGGGNKNIERVVNGNWASKLSRRKWVACYLEWRSVALVGLFLGAWEEEASIL